MANLEIEDIKRRSVTGVLALTSRTGLLQIISFIGTFLLTIFLSPEVYGVFFIVSAIVAFLNYFSDIGLAAALVQKDKITEKDYQTTFVIQQGLVIFLSLVVLFFSQRIAVFYNLSSEGLTLLRALVLAFFLSSLKTIPSVILERKLDFNKLVIPQIFEVLAFYILAVTLAWKGWGINSFSVAVLARGVVGLVSIYIIQPWIPSFALKKSSAKKLLSFGVPFQLNSVISLVKDDLFTLFLGKILPFAEVGYIGWGKKWAEVPLRLIMDSVVKVIFPAYSRLKKYPQKLSYAIDKSLYFLTLFIFPMAMGLLLIMGPFVDLFPKYGKWQPALLSFYFFVVSSVMAGISNLFTNTLNALGKIKTTLKLMIMWTILTWVISPVLIRFVGFNGMAIAHTAISATFVFVLLIAKKHAKFNFIDSLQVPLIATLIMGLAGFFIRGYFIKSLFSLFIFVSINIVVYLLVLFTLFKESTIREIGQIKTILIR